MTALAHAGRPARQNAGFFERAVAGIGAVFRHWAAVRQELADVSGSGKLGVRAERLMRSYY